MDDAIRAQILSILDSHGDMTLATVRPDGYPQATTVTYVHDGLAVFFVCDPNSQKARNIALNPKVSAAIDQPAADWNAIEALSLGGAATLVKDREEILRVGAMFLAKFKQAADYAPLDPASVAMFRIDPEVVSVIDYSKGFGHTELVTA